MTVAELIEELKKQPQDAVVGACAYWTDGPSLVKGLTVLDKEEGECDAGTVVVGPG